jgi:SAM-dependent methyltransferase
MAYDPSAQWAVNLTEGGYENHCRGEDDLKAIRRFGFAWRRIFAATGLSPTIATFEIGCGGGEKIAPLALNGARASGIDVSRDVLERAGRYIGEIEAVSGQALGIDLVQGDFLAFESADTFDLVYHFGVVEHYLDGQDRARFWGRAVALARPGGWVASIVPCGRHIMRPLARERELLGYQNRLAEIDYSAALHEDEFRAAGLTEIKVLPHGYFFFLSGHPSALVRALYRPLFIFGNVVLPYLPLPVSVLERFAQTLIVVGRRP